MTFNGK